MTIHSPGTFLSFLMGAEQVSDAELGALGVEIVEGAGSPHRALRIPEAALERYKALVREKLTAGFWNEIVGAQEIIFIFKLADATLIEMHYSASNCAEIGRLCSALNGDPLEKTSDVLRYLAENPFYRDFIAAHYFS